VSYSLQTLSYNLIRIGLIVTTSSTTVVNRSFWEGSAGFTSALIPNEGDSQVYSGADAFNAVRPHLKLGATPLDEGLQQEAEKALRDEAAFDPHANATLSADIQFLRPTLAPGLIEPTSADMLPQPPSFKSIDVRREVERVRDARKRIRLDPVHLNPHAKNLNSIGPQVAMARARSLPSICAYTLHDTSDGVPCTTFSLDSTLMASGFSESYIRLWNLKGEKLKGMRSDFQESTIRDGELFPSFLIPGFYHPTSECA
jgi:transcription initiation factor TFIID subunit 5